MPVKYIVVILSLKCFNIQSPDPKKSIDKIFRLKSFGGGNSTNNIKCSISIIIWMISSLCLSVCFSHIVLFTVMHSVMRWGHEDVFQGPKFLDEICMEPDLEGIVEGCMDDHWWQWETQKSQALVKPKVSSTLEYWKSHAYR